MPTPSGAASAPARMPAQPAAAFMVPLGRDTPVDLTRRSSAEDVSRRRPTSPRRQAANRGRNRGSRQGRNVSNRGRNANTTRDRSTTDRNTTTTETATNVSESTSNSRIRPGTVVLNRPRPRPGDNVVDVTDYTPRNHNQNNQRNQNQSNQNQNQGNQNQNNANGDITRSNVSNTTSASRQSNTNAESTVEAAAANDSLNETLGDLLIDSDEEEVVNVNEIPSPQDSLTVATSFYRYELKQSSSLSLGGERGNAPAQFACPRGVSICPVSGSIIVADSSNHRVQVFSGAGEIIHHFGGYGQANGEFDCLAGVAINLLGEIIVADRYNHRVQVFDRYGAFSHRFGEEGSGDGQLNYPWGIAVDRSGFIYVCDKEKPPHSNVPRERGICAVNCETRLG